MHNFLILVIVILDVKKETYTGVMAMDWQDTYVTILSLVIGINYIFTDLLDNCTNIALTYYK